MSNTEHCLCPVFTKRIIQLLIEKGRSVNLIGAEGCGRKRLLEDIRDSKLPDTRVVLIDSVKSYQNNYAGLVRDVWTQLGKDGEAPETLGELFERYEENDGKILLLLHHFDALLDNRNVDANYNTAFYDCLNYLRNKPNIALICVTQKPHDQSVAVYDGATHRNSWLDLEKKELHPLTHDEIKAEILRHSLPNTLTTNDGMDLVDAIHTHPQRQYEFLNELVEKILCQTDQKLPFKKRLAKWKKEFDKSRSLFSPAEIDRTREKIGFWRWMLGLDSEEKVTSRWKFALSVIVGLFSLLGALKVIKPEWVEPLMNLLKNWLQ